MRRLTIMALFAACVAGMAWLPAVAQTQPSRPVAIVEDVKAARAGVGLFEYLEVGRLIRLSAGDELVLGYLDSCIREIIQGGEVTVGSDQSSVAGGRVIREEVECDGGSADLSAAEASQSGVVAFRQGPQSAKRGTQSEPIKVFSSEPVFLFSEQVSELVIHRLDRDQPDLRVPVRQAWLNLADHNLSLRAGGLYEARVGTTGLVFEIVPYAGAGGPVVGRIVRF